MKRITRKGCWASACHPHHFSHRVAPPTSSRPEQRPRDSLPQPTVCHVCPSTSSAVICAQQVSICPSSGVLLLFLCLWRVALSADPQPRHLTTSCQALPSALDTLLEQNYSAPRLWATVVRPPEVAAVSPPQYVLNLQLSYSCALLGVRAMSPVPQAGSN